MFGTDRFWKKMVCQFIYIWRSLCWTTNIKIRLNLTYRIFCCWPLSTARKQRIFFLSGNRLVNYFIIKIIPFPKIIGTTEALWCHGWFDIVLFTTYLQGNVSGALRKNKWPPHLFVTTDIGRNMIIMFTGSIDGVINFKVF